MPGMDLPLLILFSSLSPRQGGEELCVGRRYIVCSVCSRTYHLFDENVLLPTHILYYLHTKD
jgi:hypothetical protein